MTVQGICGGHLLGDGGFGVLDLGLDVGGWRLGLGVGVGDHVGYLNDLNISDYM